MSDVRKLGMGFPAVAPIIEKWINKKLGREDTSLEQPIIDRVAELDALLKLKSREKQSSAYFKGLQGLQPEERATWVNAHSKDLLNLSESEKENYFKNKVFTELFSTSTDPNDQKIWANRSELTKRQRDALFALKAIAQDLDGYSDKKETPLNPFRALIDPMYVTSLADAKSKLTLRDLAANFLEMNAEELVPRYQELLNSMDTETKEKLLTDFHELSAVSSPYYKEYIGTDKLPVNPVDNEALLAKFNAWLDVGGELFAQRKLNLVYLDQVANRQSGWEKGVNSGALFIDSAGSMILRGIGMLGAMTTIGKEDKEDYWENVIDNNLTRYADRIATTNTWLPEELKRLETAGLSDNPIINTVELENLLLSANTPFEIIGQYGFTTASTLLSLGGSAAILGIIKGVGTISKIGGGAKGLKATEEGVKMAQALIRTKDIGNFAVAAGIGGVEGGMNAAQTRQELLKAFNQDIQTRWDTVANNEIAAAVKADPTSAIKLLEGKGYEIPKEAVLNDANILKLTEALQQEPDIREAYLAKHQGAIAEEKKKAEEEAKSAMYTNFIGNSIINGAINVTLKASLEAPDVQRTLSKYGLGKKTPFAEKGIEVSNVGNTWKATAKKFTRKEAFKNRLNESVGEGIEEYLQDLSGGFASGQSDNKMKQYIDYKYGSSEGTEGFETDIVESFTAGLVSMGEKAVSKEAIKAGLYGALSTFIGGANVNSSILTGLRGPAKKLEGESSWDYVRRRSPIEWRSGITPLLSGKETSEVNKAREQTAKNVNDFFANKETLDLFFNINASTNWMTAAQKAAESGKEKDYRDALTSALIANVSTLNTLKGSAFYDAIIASLNARANFNLGNLDNPESSEAKAIEAYKNSIPNKTAALNDGAALEAIRKNSTKLLDMISLVETESKLVEKLFGESVDKDVKEALTYQRIVLSDYKKRMGKLDEELTQVESTITKETASIPQSNLNAAAKKTMAKFGSLGAANKELKALTQKRDVALGLFEENKGILKGLAAKGLANLTREEILAQETAKDSDLALKEELAELDAAIKNHNKETAEFRSAAKVVTTTSTDEKGNEITTSMTEGSIVLSPSEIMNLDVEDRTIMLNPANKDRYSKEQLKLIDLVKAIGTLVYSDFDSKVLDRGQLQRAYHGTLQTQLTLMLDPTSFMAYTRGVKQLKEGRLLEKKYQYLNEYKDTDYTVFAQELNRLYRASNRMELNAINTVLTRSESPLFKKYQEEQKRLDTIAEDLDSNSDYTTLDDNGKALFQHSLDFLSSKDIDFNNKEAVTKALAFRDEEGVFEFERYLNTVNSEANPALQVLLTSIPEVILGFHNIIATLSRIKAERAVGTEPIVTESTPSALSAPPSPFIVQPRKEIEEEEEQPAATSGEPTKFNLVSEEDEDSSFSTNSGVHVAKAANLGRKIITNTPGSTASVEAKALAIETLDSFQDKEFDTVEEFSGALVMKANELDINAGEDPIKLLAAGLLRTAAMKMDIDVLGEAPSANEILGFANVESKRLSASSMVGGPTSPDSNSVESLNMNLLASNYSSSPNNLFLEKYKVREFLSKAENLTSLTPIMFLSDPQLVLEVEAELLAKRYGFSKDQLPLVAVVKVASGGIAVKDDKGVITHYQPIGIMPSTTTKELSGSARLGIVRENASNQELGLIIRDKNGKPFMTTLMGYVRAHAPTHLPTSATNLSMLNLGIEALTEEEKKVFTGLSKAAQRVSPLYTKVRNFLLSRLRVSPDGTFLELEIDNLKGKGKTPIHVFRTPVSRTEDRNSNRLIIDLFREDLIEDALKSNSRIERFTETLTSFFKNDFKTGAFKYTVNPKTQLLIPSATAAKELKEASKKLHSKLENFLRIPAKQGWLYNIVPTTVEGEFNLLLESSSTDLPPIQLAVVKEGEFLPETAFNIIKNLIFDLNMNLRKRYEDVDFIYWLIDYSKIADKLHNRTDNTRLMDDNILEMSKDASLSYIPVGIVVNAPKAGDIPAGVNPNRSTGNPDNASAPPINAPTQPKAVTTKSGIVVDSDTGVPLPGQSISKKEPKNQKVATIPAIVLQIIKDSQAFEIVEDESAYINKVSGKRFARTTSVIGADKEASGKFGEFKWAHSVSRGGYEVSSANDNRFSASTAKFKSGTIIDGVDVSDKTIEDVYQNIIKKSGKNKPPSPESKLYNPTLTTKEEKEDFSYTHGYLPLWQEWANQNPKLMADLYQLAEFKTLTDQFSKTKVSLARALAEILSNMPSPWTLPSTSIGSGIDVFARDVFAGEVDTNQNLESIYPNVSQEDLVKLAQSLETLKNKLESEGITIIPRDVTVSGTLDVTDSTGQIHKIDVAGTVDLLGYDANGDFYIFDIKTVSSQIDSEKAKKYARLLSLYKLFLENTYGVKVKAIAILPIGVLYPKPKGVRGGTVKYSLKPPTGKNTLIDKHQLLASGKEYRGASPSREEMFALDFVSPNIQYDKLSPKEKELISEGEKLSITATITSGQSFVNLVVSQLTVPPPSPSITVKEVAVAKPSITIDPFTGLPMMEELEDNDDDIFNMPSSASSLDDLNKLSKDEKDHDSICKGMS